MKRTKSMLLLTLVVLVIALFSIESVRKNLEIAYYMTNNHFFPKNDEIPAEELLEQKLSALSWEKGGAIFIRIFKEESTLELFGRQNNEWSLLKTYDICRWSGDLGPKNYEGDRQSPEGFYLVGKKQLNPNSKYHLSFNLGFPNQVERAQGKTGSFLMVHGSCVSIGCYAITDSGIEEVYRIVEEALEAGQKSVSVHAYPFRMTGANLESHSNHPSFDFWMNLKPGYDLFEKSMEPPKIYACSDRYAFEDLDGNSPSGCVPLKAW